MSHEGAQHDGSSTRRWNIVLVIVGPVVSVGLFLLTTALLFGIPPDSEPSQPRFAESIVLILGVGIPFALGVATSARGIYGVLRSRGWVAALTAVPVVVFGIVVISLALWRLGWPVLVTGAA